MFRIVSWVEIETSWLQFYPIPVPLFVPSNNVDRISAPCGEYYYTYITLLVPAVPYKRAHYYFCTLYNKGTKVLIYVTHTRED